MDLTAIFENFNWLTAIGIFIAYIAADALYAIYTLEIMKHRPYRAATVGSCMHLLYAISVLIYVQDVVYIIPLALGSWVGTFLIVKREKRVTT